MRCQFMRPHVIGAVNPYGLHAAIKSAQNIQRGVVAHMQHLLRRNSDRTSCSVKDSRIGFAHAKFLRADAGVKKLAQTHALYVGVTVRHGNKGKAGRQKLKPGNGIVKERDPVAFIKKNVERRLSKQRVFF